MDKIYKIRHFDKNIAQLIVTVEQFDAPFTIDLPVDDEGNVPEGEDLHYYIMGFIPMFEIERREKIKKGLKNAEAIEALVEPLVIEETEQAEDGSIHS